MLLRIDEVFQNKGWNTRKKILDELRKKPQSAYELSKRLGFNYSTIKYHIEILEKFGLITKRKSGTKSVYIVTKNYELLKKYIEEDNRS